MFEPILGLIVAVLLGIYLVFALLNTRTLLKSPRSSAMTLFRLAANRPDPRPGRAHHASARPSYGARLFRRAQFPLSGPRPGRTRILSARRRRRRSANRTGSPIRSPCSSFRRPGFASLYAILRLQAFLPFNPQHFDNVPPDLAFNTAISFLTNTNWQAYGGETT